MGCKVLWVRSFGGVYAMPGFGDRLEVFVHVLGILWGHGGLKSLEPFAYGGMMARGGCIGLEWSLIGWVEVGIRWNGLGRGFCFGSFGWAEGNGGS